MAREDRLEIEREIAEAIAEDVRSARLQAEVNRLRRQYRAALAAVDAERDRADALASLSDIKGKRHKRQKRRGKGDATAVVVLSDWHVEERVTSESTNGLNCASLDIIDARLNELASRLEYLIAHERQITKISRIVIAALGDFISNIIHEDTAELAQLAPLAATRWAGERLRNIIDLAASLADDVIVATAVGNHGRSVMKPRIATENDHSFEQNLYLMMAMNEPHDNVTWQVGESYLNMVDLDGYRVACHHGHGIKGNVHTGASRAIAQWGRSFPSDLHVFGHHHQFAYLRNKWLANGSVIGYNAYAMRIKAEAEPPCQSLAIVCHGRGECTRAIPVFCDRDLQKKEARECQQKKSSPPSKAATSRTSRRATNSSARSSKAETGRGAVVRKPKAGRGVVRKGKQRSSLSQKGLKR